MSEKNVCLLDRLLPVANVPFGRLLPFKTAAIDPENVSSPTNKPKKIKEIKSTTLGASEILCGELQHTLKWVMAFCYERKSPLEHGMARRYSLLSSIKRIFSPLLQFSSFVKTNSFYSYLYEDNPGGCRHETKQLNHRYLHKLVTFKWFIFQFKQP